MKQLQSLRNKLYSISKLNFILIFVLLWFVVAAYLWINVVYKSPENVFKGMIKNNFATQGYTKTTTGNQNGVKTTELAQLQISPRPIVQTSTAIQQGKDNVVTQTITKGDANFVRYTSINTDRKDKDGKPMNFEDVINTWAKSEATADGSDQAAAQMMLGLMPIANLSPSDRAYLLDMINKNNIFQPDYNNVKKQTKNGRLQYVYDVKILPQPYIEMLREFGISAGLRDQVEDLDPANYQGQEAVVLKVTVDVRSRHLVSVVDGQQSDQTETYSAFGISRQVELPKKYISTDELQKRLNVQ